MAAPLTGLNGVTGGLYGSGGVGGTRGGAAMADQLGQLRSMANQAAGKASLDGAAGIGAGAPSVEGGSFATALQSALQKVSTDQTKAVNQAHAFETGASDASLSDVMIDMQKANIQFQEAVQVRNKLVAAYNDVMQMQV
ncbi:flagellar hook-basal body complex protein FliE [Robbsia andropogonis]